MVLVSWSWVKHHFGLFGADGPKLLQAAEKLLSPLASLACDWHLWRNRQRTESL